ncbi:MAG TPA: zinc ABC transporter substrate-binding protein, partial [Methanobacterium subterraneum]|nr:zinc ABC transporter substrate-binding protein [Methanobacterium subterraneum]
MERKKIIIISGFILILIILTVAYLYTSPGNNTGSRDGKIGVVVTVG